VRSPLHNVGAWSARWAQLAPQRLALVDPSRRLDYAAFDARVGRAAGWLRGRGLGKGDRVGLLLANRSAYLELVLGAARIGAVAVPMNTRLSAREIAFQLGDCRPRLVCCEASIGETVETARGIAGRARIGGGAAEVVSWDSDGALYEAECAAAAPEAPRAVEPDDPMLILYTSGTTGTPKGAVLPHRKALYNALNAQLFFGIRPGQDRVLVAAPLFHSLGLNILSLPALYAGASLVLHERFDPDAFWDTVARERITYSGGVPTQYTRLLAALTARQNDAPGRGRERASLRFLFTAGAAIAVETIRAYQQHAIVLKQGFGQTETSILCCLDEADALRRAGSVGRPVFHAELRIIDPHSFGEPPERWREVCPGETGEIVVRGPITMTGYWEREEETAATLRGEWLRTGDLARRDADGFVTLSGRARDMYISGGENVYPAEVEAVLAEHPSVSEIAVVGVADGEWGEVGRAHVVLTPEAQLDLAELREWASERLARFKLPRDLVVEPHLPRTASGKVEKFRLGS
jgi:fatty-acyl-CoA synthase